MAAATYSVEVAKGFPANQDILSGGGRTHHPVSGTRAAIQVALAADKDRGGVDIG